jgi:outer membrane protein assembly factor BamB
MRPLHDGKPDATYEADGGSSEGHTYVGGWDAMNRKRLFWDDLDGDGQREIVGDINGVWNRVTVWTTDDKPRACPARRPDLRSFPLYAAHFGPGPMAPARTLMDMDVSDLDGDGRKEIIVLCADGLVVCLDSHCEPKWTVRLKASPRCLACAGGRAVIGCGDGTIVALDGTGKALWQAKAGGPIEHAVLVGEGDAAFITEAGRMVGLPIE